MQGGSHIGGGVVGVTTGTQSPPLGGQQNPLDKLQPHGQHVGDKSEPPTLHNSIAAHASGSSVVEVGVVGPSVVVVGPDVVVVGSIVVVGVSVVDVAVVDVDVGSAVVLLDVVLEEVVVVAKQDSLHDVSSKYIAFMSSGSMPSI